jgi:hypothetical protein
MKNVIPTKFPKPSFNFPTTLLKISSLMVVFLTLFLNDIFSQNQTFTANGTFTVPAGITTITVEAWGGGGGGGAATGNPAGGGGGAGGSFVRKVISVTPGQSIPVVVGTGGATSLAGGNTSVLNTTTLLAQGGGAGSSAAANSTSGAGATGSAGASIGDIVKAGGDGGTGTAGATAGGGGQGGGISAKGNNGTSALGGKGADDGGPGGLFDGGNGGDPGGNSSTGNNGTAPGGGGGGGRAGSNTDQNGGNGARGEVRIHWCTTAPVSATLTSYQDRQDPGDLTLTICPGTLIGGGGENDLEIFNSATANGFVTNGYTFLWEVSASYDNGVTFSAYAPAANGNFPNSGIAATQTAGNPYYNTDAQYPFYSYYNTNGIYKFRLKLFNACGSSVSDSDIPTDAGGFIKVTVGGAIATASTSPNPDQLCNNNTLILAGSSVGGGATTGQWTIFSSIPAGITTAHLSNTAFQNNAGIASTILDPPNTYVGTVILRLTSNVVAGLCGTEWFFLIFR